MFSESVAGAEGVRMPTGDVLLQLRVVETMKSGLSKSRLAESEQEWEEAIGSLSPCEVFPPALDL